MKNATIRQKVLASFGLILLVMAGIGALGYIRLGDIETQVNGIEEDTLPGLYQSSQIKDALSAGRAIVTRHIISADPAERLSLRAALKQNRAKLAQALEDYESNTTIDDHRKMLGELRSSLALYQGAEDALLDYGAETVDEAHAVIADRLDPPFQGAINSAQSLSTRSRDSGIERATTVREDVDALQFTFVAAFGLALLVAIGCAIHLLRTINRPLDKLTALMEAMREGDFTQRMVVDRQDELGELGHGFNRMADEVMGLVAQVQKSGIRVSTSMTEIAATSRQQQATASEVAATTTEIGATSREISATSKELVRTMNEVAVVAEHASSLASSGQTGLSQMEETMGQVMEAASTINTKLAVLNEKAGNINQVVTTITKVADQTNLLSLNAAIEAEKAGEYGRGFAVVSSEIRRLADQTAVATLDIEEMIKEIQAAVSAGVMGMDKFAEEVRRGMRDVQQVGEKLSDVIEHVQTLVPRFEAVNEGMEAQATGAEQISEALLQLTETTRQTVEALHQSSNAIDELSQVSSTLHSSVARFKLAS